MQGYTSFKSKQGNLKQDFLSWGRNMTIYCFCDIEELNYFHYLLLSLLSTAATLYCCHSTAVTLYCCHHSLLLSPLSTAVTTLYCCHSLLLPLSTAVTNLYCCHSLLLSHPSAAVCPRN